MDGRRTREKAKCYYVCVNGKIRFQYNHSIVKRRVCDKKSKFNFLLYPKREKSFGTLYLLLSCVVFPLKVTVVNEVVLNYDKCNDQSCQLDE